MPTIEIIDFIWNKLIFTFVGFFIIPNFPVLVDCRLRPEISSGDDVTFHWINAAVLTTDNKLQMVLSGASDELRESFGCESERSWLTSINKNVLGLIISETDTWGVPETCVSLSSKVIWFIDLNKLYLKPKYLIKEEPHSINHYLCYFYHQSFTYIYFLH